MPLIEVQDIPRGFTALAEWLAVIIYACQLRPRLSKGKGIAVALVFLGLQWVFLMATDGMVWFAWIACMVVAVTLMWALMKILCDVSWRTCSYYCMRAFVLAEFAASLEWQLHSFLWGMAQPPVLARYALLLVTYAGVFGVMGLLERRFRENQKHWRVNGRELMITCFLTVAVFAVSNLSFYYSRTPFSGQTPAEVFNIRTLVDLFGVAVLFANHLTYSEAAARKEVAALHSILQNQYAQYRMSRESIDMINRKYHDLKHQIAALRAEPDAAVREHWLDEMEADIKTYEAQNKTGNSVLDILLTSKSLYCQKHAIALTVVADGKQIDFLDVMDICTLVGNALDNAIEHELTLPDKTKRMIHVTLAAQKQFVLFQVENYCPDPPELRRGLPLTTKQDAQNHGFGLKSIRQTAQKYGGTASLAAEGGWFVLKVLLPIPADPGQ